MKQAPILLLGILLGVLLSYAVARANKQSLGDVAISHPASW